MQMTGGQALVQSLKIEGLETIFALPGIQLDYAIDAFWEERDAIRMIHPRHEQATAYMADGFARTTGKIGTCLVVPGPGLLNAAAGLSTAYACSSPVLAVTGQIASDQIGKGYGALHEINNQLETISSVVKSAERAMTPEEIPGMVRRAFQALRTGRPRPVEIEVPPDVLERVADVTLLEPDTSVRSEASPGDPDLLARAAEILGKAERPVIWSGGGVLSAGAWEELRELSRILEAPVVMSSNGRGAVSDHDYRGHSGIGPSQALFGDADAVLIVGSRFFLNPRFGVSLPPELPVIQIDVDPDQIGKTVTPHVGIEADAKAALGQLVNLVPASNRARASREAELTALKERTREANAKAEMQAAYALTIREELPDDGILVSESTQVGYWAQGGGYPVYEPRTMLTSGYQGTLGYGYATALGAQVGNPDKKVVSINGDGGFFYNVQELSTQAQQQIPLVTVVFNDNGYGNVRRMQVLKYNGHKIATDLQNPDMVQMAEAFGVAGYRADTPESFRGVLREALASNAPALIEVPVPPAEEIGTFPMTQDAPRPVLDL
jgi:acetolactate synthase-1/2/3 large subunit